MKTRKRYLFILFLLSGVIYSQQNTNPNIINKDIKVNNAIDIIDYYSTNNTNRFNRKLSPKMAKIPVYYKRNFYSQDILKKIDPDSISSIDIIKIPDSLSKDLRAIIYVR